ncbi:MAG: hypothetical protein NZ772_10000, partial [Cyanobacteria bacterium]|nr:hypothetical protein [Cyanobacteriota bacterium]
MTTQSTIVRYSELLNLLVLDRTSMEELGQVETLWMYPQKHRVLGLISKSGFLGSQKAAFNLGQLDTLGERSILVNSKPEPTDAKKVKQLQSLIGSEVWTDAGSKAGEIIDCLFNLRTGVISNYLMVVSRWRGLTDGVYVLPPDRILSMGKARVLIAAGTMASLTVYTKGLKQQLTSATQAIKADYEHLTADMRTAAEKAKATAEHTAEQLQSLTGQVKERAKSWLHQARATAQRLSHDVKERSQAIVQQAQAVSQEWLQDLDVEPPRDSALAWDDSWLDEWEAELTSATPTVSTPKAPHEAVNVPA